MQIGELAAQIGLNPKTIRYYEDIGVLPPPHRTPAGYRLYTTATRERLQFIAQAKAVGLTLGEIRTILSLKQVGQVPCPHVRAVVAEKIAAIDVQLQALHDMRQTLVALHAEAPRTCSGDTEICGIIEQHVPAHTDVLL